MKKNEQYKDQGLRLAIQRKTEADERMTLSDDFTDRLMQRINQQTPKPRHHYVWLYSVIASVAAILLLLLMLHDDDRHTEPKESPLLVQHTEPQDNGVRTKETEQEPIVTQKKPVIAQTKQSVNVNVKKANTIKQAAQKEQKFLAQETLSEVRTEENDHDMAALGTSSPQPHVKPATLSERDIPISHPENYYYTYEELARMKKQANEAYLRQMEQELEIAKCNLKNSTATVPL